MDNIPYVSLVEMSYENVVAICPSCGLRNTFNRASDLKDLSPIMDKEVHCLNNKCQKLFRINGDIINLPYELLIIDCDKLKAEKHYSNCILNLAQSFEMFFALYLRVEILYKPFAQEEKYDLPRLKSAKANLTKKIKDLSFYGMRALFLNHIVLTRVLMKRRTASLQEAKTVLAQLTIYNPDHEILSQVDDPKFAQLLKKISVTKINDMRNKVVHKGGYRPSLTDVESSISEAKDIIYGLLPFLGQLTDHHEWYRWDVGKFTSLTPAPMDKESSSTALHIC